MQHIAEQSAHGDKSVQLLLLIESLLLDVQSLVSIVQQGSWTVRPQGDAKMQSSRKFPGASFATASMYSWQMQAH